MPEKPDYESTKIALSRYDIAMSHLRFELNQFWTRFGFMMVSETALLGFFFVILVDAVPEPKLVRLVLALPICGVALSLLGYFRSLHGITAYWINRYLKVLDKYEPAAFDDFPMGRKEVRDAAPGHLRDVAMRVIALLVVLWVLLTIGVLIGIGWALSRMAS